MANAARCQRDPLVDSSCRFCEAKGTKWHRCFDCPLADSIRPVFNSALQWIKVHCPHWVHASVVPEHKDLHILRLIFNNRPFLPRQILLVTPTEIGGPFH